MSVFDCLFTCVIYAYELLPKIGQSFHVPLRLASSCGMAAAAEGSEDCSRSGGTQGAVTGDGEPEEAEEFTCPAYCSELSRRQNEQRKAGLFCDATLVFCSGGVSEERIQILTAHRSVLSAASHYFTLLLGGQFSESVSRRVELKEWSSETGLDPDTVSSVIQFMYTGEIRVTTANVHEVLELADRFLLVQLKNFCGEFLMKKLSLSNCVAVHSLAHMYTLDQLALGAAETIRRNFHKVIHKEEFYTLPFHLVRDWLSDSEITVDSEQELFETIVKWVHQNMVEREKHFEELFRLLRLPQIAPSILTQVVRKEPLVANSASCQKLVSDTLEIHAVRFESLKLADLELHASYMAAVQPRFGQNMDVIMVVGGVSEGGEYLSECVGYFVAEDRWVNLPHIHNHLDGHAIAVTDSHVYVAGSMEPGFAKMAERYNPNCNSWEQVSSLTSRKHSFSLACVKDILYSIGGHGNFSPGFKDVTVYDPDQDEWHNLEPAPKILRDVKTVSVEDRYVYVMARTPVDMDTGDGLSTVTNCYDTESHKWQEVDSLPLIDNYCIFQMAVASTNFYHTASCCPKTYKVTVEAAQQKVSRNISDDILDSLPPEVLGMEGAAICYLGEDIFIIGGWRNSNNMDKQYRKEVYRYCAERKRWMLLPPLPQPRCRAAACHVRIPYHYLYGCQRFPMPQNLARQRDRMQQMQQLHRRTLTLRRQLQSQIEC
ncbi:kelch-like protein 11 [Seriola lalandi dorsalis]|uniref:Kelch-like family member 11 n=2 Tax=Seriola lalandi dorsalis TaxID=1841481 RepID=A0A3B4Y8L2_SERLL|nr:kelch-like protein 11 [Seriola lalandi dorsalis]XP_056222871.1 kelch-like protein 11 [Seriola aureovittata]